MAKLTMKDVARIAIAQKFPNPALAVAVCWAESGGNTLAVNVVDNPASKADKSRDRGLWQINSYWHPEVTDTCCFNPTCCAKETFRISSGGRAWTPWTTFNHGSHTQFMQAAQKAVLEVTLPPPKPLPVFDPLNAKWGLFPIIGSSWSPNPRKPNIGMNVRSDFVKYLQGVLWHKAGQRPVPAGWFIHGHFSIETLHGMRHVQAFFNRDGQNRALSLEAWNGQCGPETWKIVDFLSGV